MCKLDGASTTIIKTEIFDVNGRSIININQSSETVSLDLTSLSNGIYLLKIESENGSETKRIIKN